MPKCAGCSGGGATGPTGPSGPAGPTGATGPGGGGAAPNIFMGFEFLSIDAGAPFFTQEDRLGSITLPGDFSFNGATEMVSNVVQVEPGGSFTIYGFFSTAFTIPPLPFHTFVNWHVSVGNADHTERLVAAANTLDFVPGFTVPPLFGDWGLQQSWGSDLSLQPGPFGRILVTSAAGGIYWGTLTVLAGASSAS